MSIGILAYGSLIDNPGTEIEQKIIDRLTEIHTPFKVEFARLSTSRGNAPTLIPTSNCGAKVKAVILVLNEATTIYEAKNILYRREHHKVSDKSIMYTKWLPPTNNQVRIKALKGFSTIDTVLYTYIQSNIRLEDLTAKYLASMAINSVYKAKDGEDDISYLMSAKHNGIITPLLPDYDKEILKQTSTGDLNQALIEINNRRHNAIQ
ncbi:hypothetical protein X793_05610 [Dehalococcoides mccartyi CG4]|uniref:hypothetical protein n=1 Tax=Dehalococcoides mccartyi TaxID=61435 RepID=UPI0004E06DB3|nr:hypothetical protein [Dehalococcoides mccartyi]AII60225.1 hypothetical protein X793_05610 [Dehalococcoides mccartyi CG4]